MILEPEELRAIIEGRRQYRRCPTCGGKGFVYADEEGNVVEYDTGYSEECDVCHRVGYVVAVYEDEGP